MVSPCLGLSGQYIMSVRLKPFVYIPLICFSHLQNLVHQKILHLKFKGRKYCHVIQSLKLKCHKVGKLSCLARFEFLVFLGTGKSINEVKEMTLIINKKHIDIAFEITVNILLLWLILAGVI